MAKAVKAKWGVGPKEPDDIPDFPSNDEIVKKNKGKTPRGVFRTQIKRIIVTTNKNDDQMLKVFAEINDTDKARKSFNGYFTVTNQNVTEQGAPYVKKLLACMGLTWADFINKTKLTADEPQEVVQIGKVKFGEGSKVLVSASYRGDNYEGEDRAIVGRWMPLMDEDDNDPDADEEDDDDDVIDPDADEDEDADDDADDADDEDGDDDDDDDDSDEDEDDEPDEEELREELAELGLKELRKRLKDAAEAAEEDAPDTKGMKKPALIDAIVALEISGDEDDDDEEDEDDEDAEAELREELGGKEWTLAKLKKRAKKAGASAKQLKTTDSKKLVDVIVELELDDDDDDEDGEPPF